MDLRTNLLLALRWNGIRDDHLGEARLLKPLQRRTGQHSMRAGGPHFARALIGTGLRALNDRAGRIDHVVEQERALPFDVADNVHDLRLVGSFAPLVDDGQAGLESLRKGSGTFYTAGIRRHNYELTDCLLRDVLQQHWQRIQMVDRDVEKSLDLTRMKIHGHDSVRAGSRDKVGD